MVLFRLIAGSWLLLLVFSARAQAPDPEFGKVAPEWLTQDTYAPYPSAKAVMLLDRGEIEIFPTGENMRTVYTLHQRIKILNESGLTFGSQVIRFQHEGNREEISKLEGLTIWQDETGKVHQAPLRKEDIYEEVLDDEYTLVKFSLPQVKVGAVVEFLYQKERKESYHLPTWYFQGTIPVVHSSYTTRIPNWYYFGVALTGEGFSLNEEAYRASTMLKWESQYNTMQDKRGAATYNGTATTYALSDLPPLVAEPYMTHLRDYAARASFQLKVIQWPKQKPKTVQLTWQEVIDELVNELDIWKDYLNGGRHYRKWLEEEGFTGDPTLEMAQAIHARLQQQLRWDGTYSFHEVKAPKEVLAEGEGNSGEINLLLTLILKEAGFPAYPALLSTREYGKINRAFPSLDPFNQVIAAVNLDQTWHLLDATLDDYPFDRLPESNLNHTALLIDPKDPSWLNVGALYYDMEKVSFSGQIDETGKAKGTVLADFLGYAAHRARRQLTTVDGDAAAFFKQLGMNETLKLQIENASVTPNQQEEPFKAQLQLEADPFATKGGAYLYFQPASFFRVQKNPFRLEKRNFPVDYSTPKKWVSTGVYMLPTGYEVESLPESCEWEFADGALFFMCQVNQTGPILQASYLLEVRESFFEPDTYADLRGFYDQVVAKVQEQVVLIQTEDP